MIAATTRITTTACRRHWLIIRALTSPIFPRSQLTTGSSNTIPITKLIISSVSMYDWMVSIFATSGLT